MSSALVGTVLSATAVSPACCLMILETVADVACVSGVRERMGPSTKDDESKSKLSRWKVDLLPMDSLKESVMLVLYQ